MSKAEELVIEGQPLAAEVPSVTVPQLIRQRARERAGKTALVEAASGRSYTYGALDHLIGRFAAGLAAQGLEPGDTLIMFMPNLPEWPIAAFGAMSAGGVVSGANSCVALRNSPVSCGTRAHALWSRSRSFCPLFARRPPKSAM